MRTTPRKRVQWIDDVKIVAGILMLIDHSMLYSGFDSAWPRYTITRSVEPIYIFTFGYLLASRVGPFALKRWVQILCAGIIETMIHSHREGEPYFGILASLAVVIPITPWLGNLNRRLLVWLMNLVAVLATIPIQIAGATVDYGPALVFARIIFGILVAKYRTSTWTLLWAWMTTFTASAIIIVITGVPSGHFWTLIIGNPLAWLIISVLRRWPGEGWRPRGLGMIVTKPFVFYIGHLLVLQFLSWAFGS